MQPQVLELNSYNIQYLITLVNGIYTSKKLQVAQCNFSYGYRKISFKKYKRSLCFHFTENLQKNYPCEKR